MSHYQHTATVFAEQIVNTRDTTRAEPEYLRTPADLARYLESWQIPAPSELNEQDLADVLVLRQRLRAVFEARDLTVAAALLNELLASVQVSPRIAVRADGKLGLELDVAPELPLVQRLGAKAALSLSAALAEYGIERLHVCNAAPCTDVFIDTSRNHTRRYCCEQCATRHNVAAYRRRQRTA